MAEIAITVIRQLTREDGDYDDDAGEGEEAAAGDAEREALFSADGATAVAVKNE